MKEHLAQIVESIIFVSDQPVDTDTILAAINETSDDPDVGEEQADKESPAEQKDSLSPGELEAILEDLLKKYEDDRFPFEIKKIAKGFQFFTKRPYHPYLKRATLEKNKRRLSRAAMETLAIIAYRQPVTKAEVEFIRGVNCDYAIQKLLEKQLVAILGRADAVGRPLLYGTSAFFMQHFGINGVEDLPKLKEFEDMVESHQEMFRQHQADLNETGGEGADVANTPAQQAQAQTEEEKPHGEA